MNILIVSEPGESGVFAFVEALCHYLIGHGVTVHLAYSNKRGSDRLTALVGHVASNGGVTVNLEVGNGIGVADLRAFSRLRRLAARVRPDVIHCHSSKAGVLGRSLALVGVDSAFVYQPHAYFGMRPARRKLHMAYDVIEACFGRIGTTIVISSSERQFAIDRLKIPPGRLKLIANGVDTDRFAPARSEEKRALRERFGIPSCRVVLGALSRLGPQKDPVTLYKAFASASARMPDLHLFQVGTGELELEVDRLIGDLGIGDRVTRLRYMSDPTGFYKAVDGFILTSTYEGMSLATLEAMSSNLPLILSRAPGNLEMLALPLSHAWGAAPGDVEGFTRCIYLWHASQRAKQPPNHRSVVQERFDCDATQAEIFAYYRSLLQGSGHAMTAWSARIPVLALLALIAIESSDEFSRANTELLLYPFFHFLTGVSHAAFYHWNYALRKTGHVLGYSLLGALLHRLARFELPRSRPRSWSVQCAALALAGTVLVAALDEWHQSFIPSRTGTLADVLLDSAAGLLAQVLILLSSAIRGRGLAGRVSRAARPMPPNRSGRIEMAGK